MRIHDRRIFKLHAEMCKVLASPNRLMILALLGKRDMSVGEIARSMEVHISNVSQHLRILKQHNVVSSRKEGQTVYYSLVDRRMVTACNLIRSVLLDSMKSRGEIAQEFNLDEVVVED